MTSMQLSNTIQKIIKHKMTIEEAFRRYPGYEQQILNGLRAAGAAGTAIQKLVICKYFMQAAGAKQQVLAYYAQFRLDLKQSMEQLVDTYSQLTIGDIKARNDIGSKILSDVATVIDTQSLSDYDKHVVTSLQDGIKHGSWHEELLNIDVDRMINNALDNLGLLNI